VHTVVDAKLEVKGLSVQKLKRGAGMTFLVAFALYCVNSYTNASPFFGQLSMLLMLISGPIWLCCYLWKHVFGR
jgi:hypothetical protein